MSSITRDPIRVPRFNECPYEKPYGYVYLYTNRLNGNKYIGKHKFNKPHIDPRYKGSGTRRHWGRALEKYGWENFDKEVLMWVEDNGRPSAELNTELNNWEVYFIDIMGTFDNPSDYNETHGGDGITPDLISGEKNPMYGDHRNAGSNNYFYGKHFYGELNPNYGGKSVTEYQRKHMSELMKGRTPYNKGVPMSDERLAQHTEAMRELAKDPEWKHKQKQGCKKRSSNQEWVRKNKELGTRRSKAVYQYDLDMNFIAEHNSVAEAGRSVNKGSGNIAQCCNGRCKSVYGFIWRYKSDIEAGICHDHVRRYKSHPVVRLTLEGKLVKKYDFLQQAKEDGFVTRTAISDCCLGRKKSYKGYIWMYLEDYEKMKRGD